MIKVYEKWPEIAKKAFYSDYKILQIQNVNHIVFAGMGGSGTIGDIFSSILSKTNIHVSVIKGYLLPRTIDEKTLIIVTSVSGNTTETHATIIARYVFNLCSEQCEKIFQNTNLLNK